MELHPLSKETVELTATLSVDFVRELDVLLNKSGKKSPEKARSQFIEDILYEWYHQEWQRLVAKNS
jgi:hypothetical protein